MEKIAFHYELSEEAKKAKEEKVARLQKNPFVCAFLKEHNVDTAFLYAHSGKFSDYVDVMEKCEHCQGLTFCRQPMQGTRLTLAMDQILINTLEPCAYQVKEQERFQHQRYFVEKDIAQSYFDIDLLHLDISKESKEYLALYQKATILLLDKHNEKGLYLWGKPGAGKTYLTAGIANYYAKEKKQVAFVNVPKLIADLKHMFHDAQAIQRKLSRIQQSDIVILDDIGGESVTAWSRDDILLPLLDSRMERKKLTFFTSNYSMLELKQRLALTTNKMQEPVAAERLFERMKTLSDEFFVKGESRRK